MTLLGGSGSQLSLLATQECNRHTRTRTHRKQSINSSVCVYGQSWAQRLGYVCVYEHADAMGVSENRRVHTECSSVFTPI